MTNITKGDYIIIDPQVKDYFGIYFVAEQIESPIKKSNDKWYYIVNTEDELNSGVFPLSWLKENARKC